MKYGKVALDDQKMHAQKTVINHRVNFQWRYNRDNNVSCLLALIIKQGLRLEES